MPMASGPMGGTVRLEAPKARFALHINAMGTEMSQTGERPVWNGKRHTIHAHYEGVSPYHGAMEATVAIDPERRVGNAEGYVRLEDNVRQITVNFVVVRAPGAEGGFSAEVMSGSKKSWKFYLRDGDVYVPDASGMRLTRCAPGCEEAVDADSVLIFAKEASYDGEALRIFKQALGYPECVDVAPKSREEGRSLGGLLKSFVRGQKGVD